jgi:hypothetical protein
MHDHDLDLIAEYASGLLAGADETRAAQLVSTCRQCATEHDTQQEIRALLTVAPPIALTEFERSRLRRAVLDVAAPASSRRGSAWQRRWLAVAGVAATFFVVVGGAGILGQFGSGDDGGDLVTMAELADTDSAPPAGLVPSTQAEDGTMEALAADDSVAEDARVMDDESDEVGGYGGGLTFLLDAGEVAGEAALAAVIDEVLAGVGESASEVTVDEAVRFGAGCASRVEGPILGIVIASLDGAPVEVFITGDRAEPQIVRVDGTDCSTVAS